MTSESTLNSIKNLIGTDSALDLELISDVYDVDIIDVLQVMVEMGIVIEKYRLENTSFPPHTPPFKNNNIYNNKFRKEFINNNNLQESNPIVTGSWPGNLSPAKSPLKKKAEAKLNRKPKNRTAMPTMWVADRNLEVLKDSVLVDYCEKQGFDWYAAKELFISFVDYHLAKGSKFVKWNNAFYTWVRNDVKFNGSPAKKSGSVVKSYKTTNPMEGMFDD